MCDDVRYIYFNTDISDKLVDLKNTNIPPTSGAYIRVYTGNLLQCDNVDNNPAAEGGCGVQTI